MTSTTHKLESGNLQAWSIDEADFSHSCTALEKLRFLVGYSVLAPSCRNAQPWIWKEDGDALCLYSQPKCDLPVADPQGRQMIIGCGAALQHMIIAGRHFGYETTITRFPESDKPDFIARVELGTQIVPNSDNEILFNAIQTRHTNRGLFESRAIPASVLESIQNEVCNTEVWIRFIEAQADREAMVSLIVEGDLEQWEDHDFRKEMVGWIRSDEDLRLDGMPTQAMGYNQVETRLLPVAMRQPLIARLINLGEVQADRDWLLAGGAPVLAVLGTPDTNDSQRDWLGVGESLSRILLRTCAAGLSVSFFNSPAEISRLWPRIYRILGRLGFVHLIFRLGYPVEASGPTPRRTAKDVIVA
jgi:hypothetical protein